MSDLSPVDELVEMEARTNSNGLVDVTIEGWSKHENTGRVTVRFQLIDDIHSEKMDWPEPGENFHDYKFWKLLNSCNLEMRNAELLEGNEVYATKRGDEWELVPEVSRIEQTLPDMGDKFKCVKEFSWMEAIIQLTYLAGFLTIAYGALVTL